MRRGISFILLFALAAGLFAAGTWRLLYGGFAVHGEVLTGERPEAAPGLLAAVQIAQDARFTARYDAAAVTSGRARAEWLVASPQRGVNLRSAWPEYDRSPEFTDYSGEYAFRVREADGELRLDITGPGGGQSLLLFSASETAGIRARRERYGSEAKPLAKLLAHSVSAGGVAFLLDFDQAGRDAEGCGTEYMTYIDGTLAAGIECADGVWRRAAFGEISGLDALTAEYYTAYDGRVVRGERCEVVSDFICCGSRVWLAASVSSSRPEWGYTEPDFILLAAVGPGGIYAERVETVAERATLIASFER